MLKKKDLIEKEIYFTCNQDKGYVYRYIKNGDSLDSNDAFIKFNYSEYGNNMNGIYNIRTELRLASLEEKEQLLESIKQNKFIPKEQINFNKEIEYEIC